MKFNVTDEIPFERELVFSTHRDKLEDLLPYLPNVDSIEVQERVEEGDVVRLTNLWSGASSDVPAVVRSVLRPEHLTWTDRATWDHEKWQAQWNITINALPEAVSARGTTTFIDESGETLVRIEGEFLIHPERIPGVPAFVAKRAVPPLERFVVSLLQPNLRRSNQAVQQYLEDRA